MDDIEDYKNVAKSSGLIDNQVTPVDRFEKKEMRIMIRKAIESLPLKQKVLIILRDIEGLPYDEITSITGIKSGTLKSRLARARLSLKEKLRDVI